MLLTLYFSSAYSLQQESFADNELLVTQDDNIQQVFDNLENDIAIDTLVFDDGTYELNLQINRSINLRGISASHVILTGNGINSIMNVSQNAIAVIQNFTFKNADVAINSTSSTVSLKNNIFLVNIFLDSRDKHFY